MVNSAELRHTVRRASPALSMRPTVAVPRALPALSRARPTSLRVRPQLRKFIAEHCRRATVELEALDRLSPKQVHASPTPGVGHTERSDHERFLPRSRPNARDAWQSPSRSV